MVDALGYFLNEYLNYCGVYVDKLFLEKRFIYILSIVKE
jgi:hypothetical protein